jgi:hypothetical protein
MTSLWILFPFCNLCLLCGFKSCFWISFFVCILVFVFLGLFTGMLFDRHEVPLRHTWQKMLIKNTSCTQYWRRFLPECYMHSTKDQMHSTNSLPSHTWSASWTNHRQQFICRVLTGTQQRKVAVTVARDGDFAKCLCRHSTNRLYLPSADSETLGKEILHGPPYTISLPIVRCRVSWS